jgi:DNA-binding CsgD family transcriptional regulator
MLTRQEKERQVIDLYNKNKTYREIAKEVRICPRDIGNILKKASGEKEEKQDRKQSLLSPSSQAYRLFSDGKSLIDVAISLDLSESETTKYYEEYLNLKQMHELRMVYDEIGPDVMHFLELYKLSKDAHMKPEHVVNLLQMSNGYLPLFEQKYRKLRREIDLLEFQRQKSIDLGNHVEVLTKVSEKYKKEIKNLQKEKIRLEILMNNGQYERVRQIAEEEVNNSLAKRRDLLNLAVVSVLESIRQDPDKYNLLINSSKYYGGQYSTSNLYIDAYGGLILDEAQKLFELMARDLTDGIVHEPTLTIQPKTNAK